MKKVEHIGIAVKDIEDANNIFAKLFNQTHYKVEQVQSEGVITSFFKIGETKIELLQGIHQDSAIAKFISKKGEGIHHIAFEVTDIDSEIDRLISEGFELINSESKMELTIKKYSSSTLNLLMEYS